MKGLTHVKFYPDLSVGFENLPRKPQNFGDNRPLASILQWTKPDEKDFSEVFQFWKSYPFGIMSNRSVNTAVNGY